MLLVQYSHSYLIFLTYTLSIFLVVNYDPNGAIIPHLALTLILAKAIGIGKYKLGGGRNFWVLEH